MIFQNTDKRPDLETAIEFDTFKNSFLPDDERYFNETLFYTDSGRWYLFFHVTPISNTDQLHFPFFKPNIRIRELSNDQTFNWLIIHSTIDKIREFFLRSPSHPGYN
ncbi:MAG TPA: hypothetical protein ENH82_10880 [bacterium]|nr:hypothetical protein [bacterium]